jgi:hypothetical protein
VTTSLPVPNAADIAEVRDAFERSTELEQSATELPGIGKDEHVPGLKLLTGIMKATFFTDLFCYHADMRFLHPTGQERVQALQTLHPRFYLWCRNLDVIARAGIMIIIVGLAAAIGLGTILRLLYL